MTLHQAASYLAERAGKKTDMSFIKEMKDLVVVISARFKADTLAKNPSADKYYLQKFNVPVIAVDSTDECNAEIAKCDKVFKSVDQVPSPLRYTSNPFSYVGAPGGNYGFGWTTFGTEPKRRFKKLTGSFPRHTYINGYIYIFNKEIDEVGVEGVFSDPRVVANFKCGDGTPCFSETSEFPIEEQILKLVYDEILTRHLRISLPNEKILIKEDKNV